MFDHYLAFCHFPVLIRGIFFKLTTDIYKPHHTCLEVVTAKPVCGVRNKIP